MAKINDGGPALSSHTPGPVETLARLALQSDRYVNDRDFRNAVDAVFNEPVFDAVPNLLAALEQAVDALSRCYDVCDWPANGQTIQDKAIRSGEAAISKAKAEGTRP